LKHPEHGPDFIANIDVAPEIKIKGILLGMRGQTRKTVVEVENGARTVVLRTNPARGTSLEALVFLNGIPRDPEKPTAEDKSETRYLAKHAITAALKKWEQEKATMTFSYVHYVFTEESEDPPEDDEAE
jgi:hypothetical protein